MERRQQGTELDAIGGEPLDSSGFENEEPDAKGELVLTSSPDQRKGDAS